EYPRRSFSQNTNWALIFDFLHDIYNTSLFNGVASTLLTQAVHNRQTEAPFNLDVRQDLSYGKSNLVIKSDATAVTVGS
ncbi:MAG: hypothetical protein ACREN8_08320, partial [Candidatus Dormibacteraceae bacterium]